MPSNPRITEAVARYRLTTDNLYPVDTANKTLIPFGKEPLLDPPKHRPVSQAWGSRWFSYQLRFLFIALNEWREKRAAHRLAFVTVHLSDAAEQRLIHTKKSVASAYGDMVAKRLTRAATNELMFYFVMEYGNKGDKRLHVHFVMAYHPDDEQRIKECFSADTTGAPTAYKLQTTYRQYFPAMPGSPEAMMLELDEEFGCSSYPLTDLKGRRYAELPVNMGAADYVSKALRQMNMITKSGRPWYAPRGLVQRSNELYREAYAEQQRLQQKAAI